MPDLITLDEYERRLAEKYGVPLAIVQAVRGTESNSQHIDPKKPGQVLTSHKGARSRFQVMPDTFKEMGGTDPNDVWDNTYAGIKYLAKGYQETAKYDLPEDKRWAAALVHYHGGPGGLESSYKTGRFRSDADPAKGIPGMHSDAYARKVLAQARKLREQGVGGEYTDDTPTQAAAPTIAVGHDQPARTPQAEALMQMSQARPRPSTIAVGHERPPQEEDDMQPWPIDRKPLSGVQPAPKPQYRAAPARHTNAAYGQPTIAGAIEAYPLGSPQRPTPVNPTWIGRQRQAAIAAAPMPPTGAEMLGQSKEDIAAAQRKAVAERVQETAEAAKPNKLERRFQIGTMIGEARAIRGEINDLDTGRLATFGLTNKDQYEKERNALVQKEKALLQEVEARKTAEAAGWWGSLPYGAGQVVRDIGTVAPYSIAGGASLGGVGALAGGIPAIPLGIAGALLGTSAGIGRLQNWEDPKDIPSGLIEMSLPVGEFFAGAKIAAKAAPLLNRISNPLAKKAATLATAGATGAITEGVGAQASNLPDVLRGKLSPFEGFVSQPLQEALLGAGPGAAGGLDVIQSQPRPGWGDVPNPAEMARRRVQSIQEQYSKGNWPIEERPTWIGDPGAVPPAPGTPAPGVQPDFVRSPGEAPPAQPGAAPTVQPGVPTQPSLIPQPGEVEDPRTTEDPHRFFTRDETEPIIPNLTEQIISDPTPRVARDKGWLESMLSNDLPFYSQRGRSVFLDPEVREAVGKNLITLGERGIQATHKEKGGTSRPVNIDSFFKPLDRVPWEQPSLGNQDRRTIGGNAIRDTHAGLRAIMKDRLQGLGPIDSLKEVTLDDYVDWFNENIPSNSPAWTKLRNVFESLGEQWPDHAIVQKRTQFSPEDLLALPESAKHLDITPTLEARAQQELQQGIDPAEVDWSVNTYVDHYSRAVMKAMTPVAQAAHRVGGRPDFSQIDAAKVALEANETYEVDRVKRAQEQATAEPTVEPTVEPTTEPTPEAAPVDPNAPAPGDTQATRLAKQRRAQQTAQGTPEAVAMRREGVEGQVQETPSDLATAMRGIKERMTPTPTPVPTPTTPTPTPTTGAAVGARTRAARKGKKGAAPTETVVTEEAPPVTATPGFGKTNTIRTKDDFEDAKRRFWDATKGKGGTSLGTFGARQMGEMLSALADMGIYIAEGGARSFADWSKAMLAEVGEHADTVRKHLPHIYRQMRVLGEDYKWEGFSADEEIEAHGKAVAAAVVEKPTVTKAKERVGKKVTVVAPTEATSVTPEAETAETKLAKLNEEEANLLSRIEDDPDMHPEAYEEIEHRLVDIELERADLQEGKPPKKRAPRKKKAAVTPAVTPVTPTGKGPRGAKAAAAERVAKTEEPPTETEETPTRTTYLGAEGYTVPAWQTRIEEERQRREEQRLREVVADRAAAAKAAERRAKQAPVPVGLPAAKQKKVDNLTIRLAELEQNRAKAATELDALVKDPKSTLRDQRKARAELDKIKKDRDAANSKIWNLTEEVRVREARQVKAVGEESQLLIPGQAKGKSSSIPLAGPPDVARKEAALYKILEGVTRTRKDVRGSGPQWSTSVQGLYELGRYYVDLGIYKFSEWSSRVAQDLRELKLEEPMYPYLAEVYGQLRSEATDIRQFSTAKQVAEHIRRREPVIAKAMEAEGKPFNPLAMPEVPPRPVPQVEIRPTPPESEDAFVERIGLAMGDVQENQKPKLNTLEKILYKREQFESWNPFTKNELTLELMFREGYFKTWDEFGRAVRTFAELESEDPLWKVERWTPEQIAAQRQAALEGKPMPEREGELLKPAMGELYGGTQTYGIETMGMGTKGGGADFLAEPGDITQYQERAAYGSKKKLSKKKMAELEAERLARKGKHPDPLKQSYLELRRRANSGEPLDADDVAMIAELKEQLGGGLPPLGPELTDEQFVAVRGLVDEYRQLDTRIQNLADYKAKMEGYIESARAAATAGNPQALQTINRAFSQMKKADAAQEALTEQQARLDDQILEAKGIKRLREKQKLTREEQQGGVAKMKVKGKVVEYVPAAEELPGLEEYAHSEAEVYRNYIEERKSQMEREQDEETEYAVAQRQRKAAQKRGEDVAFMRAEVKDALEAQDRGDAPKPDRAEIAAMAAEQKAGLGGLPLRVTHRIYPEQLWKAIREAAGKLIGPSMAVQPADFRLHRIGGPIALIGGKDLTKGTYPGDIYSPNTPAEAPLPRGMALDFQTRMSDAMGLQMRALDTLQYKQNRLDQLRNVLREPEWEDPKTIEPDLSQRRVKFNEEYGKQQTLYETSHPGSIQEQTAQRAMQILEAEFDRTTTFREHLNFRNELRYEATYGPQQIRLHLVPKLKAKGHVPPREAIKKLLAQAKDEARQAQEVADDRRQDLRDIEEERKAMVAVFDTPEGKLRAMRMGETGLPQWRRATGYGGNPVIHASLVAPRLRDVEAIRARFRKQGADTLTEEQRNIVRQDIAARQQQAVTRMGDILQDHPATLQILDAAVLERERPPLQRRQHLLQVIGSHADAAPTEAEITQARKIYDEYMELKDRQINRFNLYPGMTTTMRPYQTLQKEMDKLSNDGDLEPALAYLIAQDYATQVADYPQSYFEAKPRTLVPLSQFEAAVVPAGTDPDLIQALRDFGLYVRTYTPGNVDQPSGVGVGGEDIDWDTGLPVSQVQQVSTLDSEVRNLVIESEAAFARAQEQFDAAYQPIRELFPRTQWEADVDVNNTDPKAAMEAANFEQVEALDILGEIKLLEVNHAMSQVIGAALGEQGYDGSRWEGVAIPKSHLPELAQILTKYGEAGKRIGERINDLAQTQMYANHLLIVNSGAHITDGRLYYVTLHEIGHGFIFDVAGDKSPWQGKYIVDDPAYSHLAPAIEKLEGSNSNAAMVEKEAPAYVLAGQWKQLGFDSPESATEFLRRYVKQLAADHGIGGLLRWPLAHLQVEDTLTSIIKEVQNEVQEKGKVAAAAEKSRAATPGVNSKTKQAGQGAPVLPGGGQTVPGGRGGGAGQGGRPVGGANQGAGAKPQPVPRAPVAAAGQGAAVQRPVVPQTVTVGGVAYNVVPPPGVTPVVGPPLAKGPRAAANRAIQNLAQTFQQGLQNVANVGLPRQAAGAGGGAGQGGGTVAAGSKVGQAAQLVQQTSMLGTVKFWLNNVGGAYAMMGFEAAPAGIGQMAALTDYIINKMTGAERTFVRPKARAFKKGRELYKTLNEAAKQQGVRYEGLELGGTLPQAPLTPELSYRVQPRFEAKPASPFGTGKAGDVATLLTSDVLDATNRRSDIMAWTSHYYAYATTMLGLEMKKAQAKGRTLTPEEHESIHLEAKARADYNTLRHPNYFSHTLTFMKNQLNNVTLIPKHIRTGIPYETLRKSQPIGLGDFLLNVKFTNFPGAVAHHMVNKSIFGLFRAAHKWGQYEGAKRNNLPNTRQLRNEAIHSFAEVLSSHAILGSIFFPLGFLGIMAPGAQSYEEEQTQRSMGKEPYGINLSVLWRWIVSGFDSAQLEWRPENDTVVRMSQYFAPIAASAELMAQMGYDARTGETSIDRGFNAFKNVVDTVSELTFGERLASDLLSAVKQAQGEGAAKWMDALARLSRTAITAAAGQLVPTLLYQMTQRTDPWRREWRQQGTSAEESMPFTGGFIPSLDTLKGKLKSRVPWESKELPQQLDVWGQPVEHSTGVAEGGGFWNWKSWAPGSITTTKRDTLKEAALRLQTLPHAVQRNTGETAVEVHERNAARGARIREGGDVLIDSPAWDDAGGQEKAYLLRNLYNRAADPMAQLTGKAFVEALKDYRIREAEAGR